MRTPGAPYLNRADAGQRLAYALEPYRGERPTVLALPRGGVPVASVVADRLGAWLDFLVVRKVGAPGTPEHGLGAVAEGGTRFVDPKRVRELGLEPEDLEPEFRAQQKEAYDLARRLRRGRPPPVLRGRTVIVVDDGMATGSTIRCALEAIRAQHPSHMVVAVGVSPRDVVQSVQYLVDNVVCPLCPSQLFAVWEWYREFSEVSADEVERLLDRNWANLSGRVVAC
ncbi:MAG: phosphoribosyltransferase [Thermoplasmata archaeon]